MNPQKRNVYLLTAAGLAILAVLAVVIDDNGVRVFIAGDAILTLTMAWFWLADINAKDAARPHEKDGGSSRV